MLFQLSEKRIKELYSNLGKLRHFDSSEFQRLNFNSYYAHFSLWFMSDIESVLWNSRGTAALEDDGWEKDMPTIRGPIKLINRRKAFRNCLIRFAPDYLYDLNRALGLIPENWTYVLENLRTGKYYVTVFNRDKDSPDFCMALKADGKYPTIAICRAALKIVWHEKIGKPWDKRYK